MTGRAQTATESRPHRGRIALTPDAVCAGALFALSVAYLASLPRVFGYGDEGLYLYEAKRILDGQVLYRDIFQFVTPTAWYAMAAVFGLFGASMATARIATAVLHGLVAVLVFATCRRLGVRRSLAVVAGLVPVAVCQPLWPIASPHWLSTFLTIFLLWLLVRCDGRLTPRRLVGLGAAAGLLITVHQQKGAPLALGIAGLLALDSLWSVRRPASRAVRVALYALGGALVVVPVAALMVLAAGLDSVVEQVVLFPIGPYHEANLAPWGFGLTLATPLRMYLPQAWLAYGFLIALVPAARLARSWGTRRDGDPAVRNPMLMIVFSGFAALSVVYRPDLIHLAFIGPILAVLTAETIEWALARVPAFVPAAVRTVPALLVGALLIYDRVEAARAGGREWIEYQSAFGAVSFQDRAWAEFLDAVRARLADTDPPLLFSYPACAQMNLMAGGENPTRYDWMGYKDPVRTREVITRFRAGGIRYVIVCQFHPKDDPFMAFLKEHYERVLTAGRRIPFPALYELRDDSALAMGAPTAPDPAPSDSR